MQISDGKLYLNRTWKYIYPALRVYGAQPIGYLNELNKQGVGISDINFEEEDSIPKIFILVETKSNFKGIKLKEYEQKVSNFFDFIRKQEYYVDDYIYDMNKKCCSHMVVLRFPESFIQVYKHFQKGEYSKMYSKSMVKEYFPFSNLERSLKSPKAIISKTIGQNLEIHGVLNRDNSYREHFINNLNRDFGLDMKDKDFGLDIEYDYLPIPEEELFNFKQKVIIT